MSQSVEIDPDGVRRAARQFEEVAAATRILLETLEQACNSRGEPWGDDKPGHQFADGEKGYLANRDSCFTTLGGLIEVFEANAVNLADTAHAFEVADQRTLPRQRARLRRWASDAAA
ncbi:hypothetical protein [Nocardia sp. NPDC057353]|uniref:hypothetical protein n=1 Tax=Nocardia sp. NPDC057353 TaxID=3346104 RepID=UPI0036412CA6